MKNLFASLINLDNGFSIFVLDYCSIIVLLSGISVIIIKNPIGSLIALICVYGFISVYLMFIGLTFIGFSYIIVYIGAVSILFLFILMLIDIRTSELQINNWNSIPLASFIVIFLNYVLIEALPQINYNVSDMREINLFSIENFSFIKNIFTISTKNIEIFYVTSNNWDGSLSETGHISTIGNMLYTSYNIWLFIISIILLLAMVGAIVITIKEK